jgi:hypothetical protein
LPKPFGAHHILQFGEAVSKLIQGRDQIGITPREMRLRQRLGTTPHRFVEGLEMQVALV